MEMEKLKTAYDMEAGLRVVSVHENTIEVTEKSGNEDVQQFAGDTWTAVIQEEQRS